MTEEELIAALVHEGVHVVHVPFSLPGAYFRRECLVVIDSRCSEVERRCTLAHELVHVRRGDDGPQSPEIEALVDERASLSLIRATEYAVAEKLVGPHPGALAPELGVTQRTVEAYQRVLQNTPPCTLRA